MDGGAGEAAALTIPNTIGSRLAGARPRLRGTSLEPKPECAATTRNGLRQPGLSFRTLAQRGYRAAQGHTAPGNRGRRRRLVPGQCTSSRRGGAGGPRAHLAHPAASGSIAPAGAGAGPGRRREAPPQPQRIPVPPLLPLRPPSPPRLPGIRIRPGGAGGAARS